MLLEQAGWRELAATAFQRPDPNSAAAVVIQHGARWLVADNRWVFLIGRSSELLPVGKMYGFSQRLVEPNPVLLDIIEPGAWDPLFAAMPGFPVETLVREGLTPAQQRDAIARRALGLETPEEIGRSYDVTGWTVSRLSA